MSMMTSRVELLAEIQRDGRDEAHRLGVVAVDVEDGRVDHLGDVRAVARVRASAGSVVKPIWLLMMMCSVPPVR